MPVPFVNAPLTSKTEDRMNAKSFRKIAQERKVLCLQLPTTQIESLETQTSLQNYRVESSIRTSMKKENKQKSPCAPLIEQSTNCVCGSSCTRSSSFKCCSCEDNCSRLTLPRLMKKNP